jgi:thiosulfate/3-mercaptopyruvate sulfurtransferase
MYPRNVGTQVARSAFGRRAAARAALAAGAAGPLLGLVSRRTGWAAPAPDAATTPLLVGPLWLAEHLGDPNLRVVDVRAQEKYDAGHIPAAINLFALDLDVVDDRKVSNLKPADQVAQLLGALGIGDGHQVVVYDDARTVWAARVFWALDYLGHSAASILDGGWPRWMADGGSISLEAPRLPAATFTPAADPAKLAQRDDVLAAIGAPGRVIVDSLPAATYQAGHVPNAINVPWDQSLAGDAPDALLKPAEALRELYADAGVTPDRAVITYCGAGVVSAQGYFVLRLLGYPQVRLYDSSWQEWGQDPTVPIEKGS